MKFIVCGFLLSAVLLCAAQDEKKEEIKVYKRLIPADVLRGEFIMLFFAHAIYRSQQL